MVGQFSQTYGFIYAHNKGGGWGGRTAHVIREEEVEKYIYELLLMEPVGNRKLL